MFAIGAAIAFIVALVLEVVTKGNGKVILDFAFAGAALVALHLVFGSQVWGPGVRR